MKHFARPFVAFMILVSGLALVPYVGLPAQAFDWQRFAAAYQPDLAINHLSGQPGSYFRVNGGGFLPNCLATISVNGIVLGTVLTNNDGEIDFLLSTGQANLGSYTVTVSCGASTSVQFGLAADDPMWPQQGSGPVIAVPAHNAYLPFVSK